MLAPCSSLHRMEQIGEHHVFAEQFVVGIEEPVETVGPQGRPQREPQVVTRKVDSVHAALRQRKATLGAFITAFSKEICATGPNPGSPRCSPASTSRRSSRRPARWPRSARPRRTRRRRPRASARGRSAGRSGWPSGWHLLLFNALALALYTHADEAVRVMTPSSFPSSKPGRRWRWPVLRHCRPRR